MELQKETLKESTLEMILKLMKDTALNDFYLAGGTALSLQLAHRVSVDIDLFTHEPFDKAALEAHMGQHYSISYQQQLQHGLVCFPDKEKVDFQYYPWQPVKPV